MFLRSLQLRHGGTLWHVRPKRRAVMVERNVARTNGSPLERNEIGANVQQHTTQFVYVGLLQLHTSSKGIFATVRELCVEPWQQVTRSNRTAFGSGTILRLRPVLCRSSREGVVELVDLVLGNVTVVVHRAILLGRALVWLLETGDGREPFSHSHKRTASRCFVPSSRCSAELTLRLASHHCPTSAEGNRFGASGRCARHQASTSRTRARARREEDVHGRERSSAITSLAGMSLPARASATDASSSRMSSGSSRS